MKWDKQRKKKIESFHPISAVLNSVISSRFILAGFGKDGPTHAAGGQESLWYPASPWAMLSRVRT